MSRALNFLRLFGDGHVEGDLGETLPGDVLKVAFLQPKAVIVGQGAYLQKLQTMQERHT